MAKPERILCAAIYIDTGQVEEGARSYGYPETGLVFCGLRHGDCIKIANAWVARLSEEEKERINTVAPHQTHYSNQGFLTSKGRYVGREEAQIIALREGQVLRPDLLRGKILFSEDLY